MAKKSSFCLVEQGRREALFHSVGKTDKGWCRIVSYKFTGRLPADCSFFLLIAESIVRAVINYICHDTLHRLNGLKGQERPNIETALFQPLKFYKIILFLVRDYDSRTAASDKEKIKQGELSRTIRAFSQELE